MNKPVLLSGTELSLGYKDMSIVEGVTFELSKGDVLAVVGHNGSGKSTLIKALLGALEPLSGRFNWPNGKPKAVGYLGQLREFDRRFPIRVGDLAAMGAWPSLAFSQKIDKNARAKIDFALERTGTKDIVNMPLQELSAGQLQRALFARTMVQDAPLILLDEPFTAIDQSTEAELLELIDSWSEEGRTIIIVLHDLSAVLRHCNKALLLGEGQALFGRPEDILTPHNLVKQKYISESQASWMETMYQPQFDRREQDDV